MEWVSVVLANGDLASLIISAILLVITGGVGVAIVNGIVASRRGVRGDALAKEQNSINGLGKLTDGQDAFITQLRDELETYRTETNRRISDLEKALKTEIRHSGDLTKQLIEHNIVPIPRTDA